MVIDTDREYELSWRKKVLKDFKRGLNATLDDRVTVVWETVPFHLSSDWALEILAEIVNKFDYRPIEWTMDGKITYVTFESLKPSQGRMEMLQKACYDRI